MKLYLVRHGKSVAPEVDSSQPLSEEGRSEISRLARTLANLNLSPESIIHSGKLRAEETARIIAESTNPAQGVKAVKGLAPNDDIAEMLALVQALDEDLMIVGHLPFLDKLLAALVKPEDPEELPSFDNGTLIGVERVGRTWQIFRHLSPSEMIL